MARYAISIAFGSLGDSLAMREEALFFGCGGADYEVGAEGGHGFGARRAGIAAGYGDGGVWRKAAGGSDEAA